MNTIRAFFCANNYAVMDALAGGYFRPFGLRVNTVAAQGGYDVSGRSKALVVLYREPVFAGAPVDGKKRADVFPVLAEIELPAARFCCEYFDAEGHRLNNIRDGDIPDNWKYMPVASFIPASFIRRLLFRSQGELESFAYTKTANVPLPGPEIMECAEDIGTMDIHILETIENEISTGESKLNESTNVLMGRILGALGKVIALSIADPVRYRPSEALGGIAPLFCRKAAADVLIDENALTYQRASKLFRTAPASRASTAAGVIEGVSRTSPFEYLREAGAHRRQEAPQGCALGDLYWLTAAKAAMEVPEANEDRAFMFQKAIDDLAEQEKKSRWKEDADLAEDVEELRKSLTTGRKILASELDRAAIAEIPKKFGAVRSWLLYCLEGDLERLCKLALGMGTTDISSAEVLDAAILGGIRQGYVSLPQEEKRLPIMQAMVEQMCISMTGAEEKPLDSLEVRLTGETSDSEFGIDCRICVNGPWGKPWELKFTDYLEDCWKKVAEGREVPEEAASQLARLLGWTELLELRVLLPERDNFVLKFLTWLGRMTHAYPGDAEARHWVDTDKFREVLSERGAEVDWMKVPLPLKIALSGDKAPEAPCPGRRAGASKKSGRRKK